MRNRTEAKTWVKSGFNSSRKIVQKKSFKKHEIKIKRLF